MSLTLCLNLGEFFVEASLQENSSISSYRWPLSKESLEKGLASRIDPALLQKLDRVEINLSILESLLRKRLGTPPAFLTTGGFENWLEMNLPVAPQHFSLHPKRIRSPLDQDIVFGLSERVQGDGATLRAPDLAEIDFLHSKLSMNEVKWVALGLMHSCDNPAHEKSVAELLRSKDFKVIESHRFPNPAERPRWWAAVLTAYMAPLVEEWTQMVKDSLEKLGVQASPLYWTSEGLLKEWTPYQTLSFLFGSAKILNSWCETQSLKNMIYLDLEGFFFHDSRKKDSLWNSEMGPAAVPSLCWEKLSLQPTSPLEESWLGSVEFGAAELGFEPGPMALGRGLIPCFLDCLWLREDLGSVLGVGEFLVERTRGRIQESLSSLARNFSKENWSDVLEFGRELYEMGVREVAQESLRRCSEGSCQITGPLSPAMASQLTSILDAKKFQWEPQSQLLTQMALLQTVEKS